MKIIYRITKFGIFMFMAGLITLVGLYLYASLLPKLELRSANSFQIFDNSSTLITQGSSSENWTKLENISHYLIDATISVEDKNFYEHQGFDYLRIIKAMYVNIKNKSISQGASTISQQYVKNLYLDFGQTWKRKIEEAFLTMQLEINYDKNEILEGYLNTINYGQGNYGIKNASNYYFNKEPSELTLEEAIILAGISKNPSNYNPISNYENSIKRAKVVAKSMVNNNFLSDEEYNNLFLNDVEVLK
ncbi:MAG: transglycosylase domain-containing protein, partial [Bacilli bacterium]|nr:transglycosylase domain-containing protein [Bacilli bacterium]